MIDQNFLDFLGELSRNNNRDWFEKNKKSYESTVKKPFEIFVAALIERLVAIEGDWQLTPAMCIHRIYRDTRFAKDKTPYKNHVSASFSRGGKKNMGFPSYYLQVEEGRFAFFGGAWMPEKEQLAALRTAIVRHSEEFAGLLAEPNFRRHFETIRGERNQRIDPEFREAALAQPLLFQKQFYFAAEMDPKKALGAGGIEASVELFEAAKPMNDFLRQAMGMS